MSYDEIWNGLQLDGRSLKGQCHEKDCSAEALAGTVALCRLIVLSVVAVSCLKVCRLQASSAAPPTAGKALHPPPTTCLNHPPPLPLVMAQCTCTLHTYCAIVAVHTLILSYCCSPHSIRVRTATVSTLNIT